MNNREVVGDFRRRWEATYVWLKMEKTQEESLVLLEHVEDHDDKVATLTVKNDQFGTLVLNFGSPDHELLFKYPPVGVFQHGVDALLFRRRPSRQYRRGLCTDNSFIRNVVSNVYGQRVMFGLNQVKAAFEHKTYSKDEALKLLSSNAVRGAALENNFAITLSFDQKDKYILWHWDNPVAYLKPDGSVIEYLEHKYSFFWEKGID